MSESYAVSEKRELLLDRVRKFILDNGGIVKKSQLAGLGIDYRRILDFVEKGDILRIKAVIMQFISVILQRRSLWQSCFRTAC